LGRQITDFLDEITLQDLLEEEAIRSVAIRQDEKTPGAQDTETPLAGTPSGLDAL
jgi:hypothetical protein